MTNQQLLSQKMSEFGYNVGRLAAKIGLSRAGLYKKISNENEFKASEILKISQLLNLSSQEQTDIFFACNVDDTTTKVS